jgi:hypothetical protein
MPAEPMLSLSQVRALGYGRMWDAAGHLDATADLWEEAFSDIHNRVASLPWEGDAREAELARANADIMKARAAAEAARATATVSRASAPSLDAAKRSVLHAVDYATEAGFNVGEDYSVTDTRPSKKTELAARQAQAQAFATDIRQRVIQLTGLQTEVAGKLTAAAAPIRELRFDEGKPGNFAPLSRFTPPPTVSLIWCTHHVTTWMCIQYFPDGSTFVYPSPTDRSGVVTQHGP